MLYINKDVLDEINYNLYKFKPISMLRKIYRFISSLPDYIKLCWYNEDWDYQYLLHIIEYKLKKMLKCIREDDIHEGMEKYEKQIELTLKRLYQYNNIEEYISSPKYNIWFEQTSEKLYKMYDDATESDINRLKRIDKIKEKCWNLFWCRLSKYSRGWWC